MVLNGRTSLSNLEGVVNSFPCRVSKCTGKQRRMGTYPWSSRLPDAECVQAACLNLLDAMVLVSVSPDLLLRFWRRDHRVACRLPSD